jgi:SAM-dependent methyltransferase
MSEKTWEEAVQWLRQQPDQQELVRACYFDDPLLEACERFAESSEWVATTQYLPMTKGQALDMGAGRGISSYALAKEGWQVTALEPDTSALVGAEAIKQIAKQTQLPIKVVVEWGEQLPFPDNSFDVVLARQVLHHARDLKQLCAEIGRVLKPNGVFIATREHVISQREDLQKFLDKHALHHLYGGENAFLLKDYMQAIQESGLQLKHVLGHWESEINFFPDTHADRRRVVSAILRRRLGSKVTELLTNENYFWGFGMLNMFAKIHTLRDNSAGRLYSFVAVK